MLGRLKSPGGIAGLLTLFSALATIFGWGPAAAFLSDPNTVAAVNTVITGVLGTLAGTMRND